MNFKSIKNVLVLLSTFSCTPLIGQYQPTYQNKVISTKIKEVASDTINYSNKNNIYNFTKGCDLVEVNNTIKITTIENYNKQPFKTGVFLGTGLVAGIAGTIILTSVVDYNQAFSEPSYDDYDYDRKNNNHKKHAANFAIGLPLSIYGISAISSGLFGINKANEFKTLKENLPDQIVLKKQNIVCENNLPLKNTMIYISMSNSKFEIGKTDFNGNLVINLDEILPQNINLYKNTYASIISDNNIITQINLDSLYEIRKNNSWNNSNYNECQNPINSLSCDNLLKHYYKYNDERSLPILEQSFEKIKSFKENEIKEIERQEKEIVAQKEKENKYIESKRKKYCIAECQIDCSSYKTSRGEQCLQGCYSMCELSN